MKINYRSIAKLLAKDMPIDGQEYRVKIEEYIKAIKAMPKAQQSALGAAYIFSDMLRGYERQDLFQELVAHILTVMAKRKGSIESIDGFCYKVARNKWKDKWLQQENRKEITNGDFSSLNRPVIDSDNGREEELQELLAGEVEFERKLNSKLDSQAVLDSLPDRVKAIVIKKLIDKERLSSSECNILHRHTKNHGQKIREALAV